MIQNLSKCLNPFKYQNFFHKLNISQIHKCAIITFALFDYCQSQKVLLCSYQLCLSKISSMAPIILVIMSIFFVWASCSFSITPAILSPWSVSVFMTFRVLFSAWVCGVFLFFLVHLLSFSPSVGKSKRRNA